MLRGVNQQQILEDREDNTKIAFVGITTPWMLRSPTFKYSGTKMDISHINIETRIMRAGGRANEWDPRSV